MEFDLGELFTNAVRQVLPIAHAKGLVCLADCEGPALGAAGDASGLRRDLHTLFCSAIDALDSGFVFFAAELSAPTFGRVRLQVHAAGTGQPAPAAVTDAVLARLGLHDEAPPAPGADGLHAPQRVASGRCATTGAEIRFLGMPPEGSVFSLGLSLPAAGAAVDVRPCHARAARAWLLSDDARWSQLIARRLQHLGWAVTAFESTANAAERLAHAHPQAHRPALVLGVESGPITLAGLQQLRDGLPATTQVVLGSSSHRIATAADGIALRLFPFSPADLRELTWHAMQGGAPQAPSGHTRPAPLVLEDRPRVLVVDDNPVNQMVATGMLQALGFEVEAAADGFEALTRCRERAPDAVLMDVQMPGLDGIETTRRLRAMQRNGELRPFPIIASTAGDSGASRRACLEAGMDAFLGKPLSLALLEAEFRRMLPPRSDT